MFEWRSVLSGSAFGEENGPVSRLVRCGRALVRQALTIGHVASYHAYQYGLSVQYSVLDMDTVGLEKF